MAILDNQITSGEINNAHVQKQPDRLEGTAQANKAVLILLQCQMNQFIAVYFMMIRS